MALVIASARLVSSWRRRLDPRDKLGCNVNMSINNNKGKSRTDCLFLSYLLLVDLHKDGAYFWPSDRIEVWPPTQGRR